MRRTVSRVIKSLATILIGCAGFSPSLQAQNDPVLTATVPFPFVVGTLQFAPGTYRLGLEPGLFELFIMNAKNSHMKLVAVHSGRQCAVELHGKLLFRTSGVRSFLSEIYFPGSDTCTELIHSRRAGKADSSESSLIASASFGQFKKANDTANHSCGAVKH